MSDQSAAGSALLDPKWATALLHARQAGVPVSLQRATTESRSRGDWRAACSAAAVDVRIDPGRVGGQILDDLRSFAPDLLRWHLPRSLPGGGPQKDLVISLAEYPDGTTLVVRTPGVDWAAGERLVLEVLDRPSPRRRVAEWRMVQHRYLWDGDRAGEYRSRATTDGLVTASQDVGDFEVAWRLAGFRLKVDDPEHRGWLRRLPVDLESLRREVTDIRVIRPGGGKAIVLVPHHPYASGVDAYVTDAEKTFGLTAVPRPAWCRPFDHELIRLRLAAPRELHPLVRAVYEDAPPSVVEPVVREVQCAGLIHRLRRERNRWIALDHDDTERGAEQFLAALGGPAIGCRAVLEELHRTSADVFEPGERYHSALSGQVAWPVPQGVSLIGPGRFRMATTDVRPLKRGRRNTKPLTGTYTPSYCVRKRDYVYFDRW